MAQYKVRFACGHTATIQLFGKEADRQRKIKWYEENGLCPDCYRAMKEEEKKEQEKKDAKEAKDLGLSELTGSEKQIAWANAIRNNQFQQYDAYLNKLIKALEIINDTGEKKEFLPRLEILKRFFDAVEQIIGSETSASKIIDWRDSDMFRLAEFLPNIDKKISSGEKIPEDYSDEYGELFVKSLKVMYGEQEPKQESTTVLSPEKKESDVLVTVSYTDEVVTVESPKEYTIIGIVKDNGFRWNGNSWNLQINLKTGKAEDRAAEIANKMLNAGYQVNVPAVIADAAVSGNYEPRCTRWISSYTDDHDHVYVSWEKDDDMYNIVKKISGSKWIRGKGMCIPTSSADEIEEFAETYGFRISAGASKKIDAYRKSVEVVAPKDGAAEEKIDNSGKIADVLNSSRDVIEDLKDDD